jgi:hypothetical protein
MPFWQPPDTSPVASVRDPSGLPANSLLQSIMDGRSPFVFRADIIAGTDQIVSHAVAPHEGGSIELFCASRRTRHVATRVRATVCPELE